MKSLFLSTFVLCLGVVRMTQMGDGEAMDEDTVFNCFVYFNCMGGPEKFKEVETCYNVLGNEVFKEIFYMMVNASNEVGETMDVDSDDPWVLRAEYCPNEVPKLRKVFDVFSVLLVEEFSTVCSDKSLEEKCGKYEEGLSCVFSLMEETAESDECTIEGTFEP